MEHQHQNKFVNANLLSNDSRRKKRSRDELDTPSDHVRQRRRLNRLYDPENQRSRLLAFLFSFACGLGLSKTFLFAASYLFDSYVVGRDIPLEDVSNCGLAAFFLAAKLETDSQELDVGQIMSFLELTDDSRLRILQLERDFLDFFGFNLWINHPYLLWDRLRDSLGLRGIVVRDFVRFLIDVCTMDHRFIDESPSRIVAASLYLTLDILNMKWTRCMSRLTGFMPDELRTSVDALKDSLSRLDHQSVLYEEWSRYRAAEVIDGVPALETEQIGTQRRRRWVGPENYLPPSGYIAQWIQQHHRV